MAVQRIHLGETPFLQIDQCPGDLEIQGLTGVDAIIEDEGENCEVDIQDNGATISGIVADCVIRLPQSGRISIGEVGGQLRINNILGGVDIQKVGGDCVARRVGAISIGVVGGDGQFRQVEGIATLGTIGGDLVLKECAAQAEVEMVGGSLFGVDVPYGLNVGRIGGDAELRTDCAPDSHYQMEAGGEIIFRVPSDSNIRFVFPPKAKLSLSRDLHAVREGDHSYVTLGSGAATVQVSTRSKIAIRCEDAMPASDRLGDAFHGAFETHMADVSAQIDAKLRDVEDRLHDLPERIRHRVERKVSAARRHAHAAERHARQAAERAESRWHIGFAGQAGQPAGDSATQTFEPVSQQERLSVLKMLEDGKISVADAQKLLAALEGEA